MLIIKLLLFSSLTWLLYRAAHVFIFYLYQTKSRNTIPDPYQLISTQKEAPPPVQARPATDQGDIPRLEDWDRYNQYASGCYQAGQEPLTLMQWWRELEHQPVRDGFL